MCSRAAESIQPSDIKKVVCIGGGFEMKWAREAAEEVFFNAEIETSKNSKGIISQGACISAAAQLGLLKDMDYIFNDYSIVCEDIGLKALCDRQEQFIPFINKGDLWWESGAEKIFILDEDKNIAVYSKDSLGNETKKAVIDLDGLPKRPKKTTRLKIKLYLKKYNILDLNIKDCGFGELFKTSDFEKNIEIKL